MQVFVLLLAMLMTAGLAAAADQPAPDTAAPPSITPGMTMDQVVALLGEPEKIADLGSKKIYVYKYFKVTFAGGKVAPDVDTTVTVSVTRTVDPLPYEIGVGGLVAVAAAFLLGRRSGRAGKAPLAPPPPPVNPVRPSNLIRRLDELEQLMELGVLTREEFETEKDKLRHLA